MGAAWAWHAVSISLEWAVEMRNVCQGQKLELIIQYSITTLNYQHSKAMLQHNVFNKE